MNICTGKVTYKPGSEYVSILVRPESVEQIINMGVNEAVVEFVDPRECSRKQQNMAWALMRDIERNINGSEKDVEDYTYPTMAGIFQASQAEMTLKQKLFSLSRATVSQTREFINLLIATIINYGFSTKRPIQENCDDIQFYEFACAMHRKCCACNQGGDDQTVKAEIHHLDRVGMGRNRDEILHEGMRCLPLCRECHMEAHQIGDEAFMEKWHLEPLTITPDIIKKYHLGKRIKEEIDSE